jgi:hypothetical protein
MEFARGKDMAIDSPTHKRIVLRHPSGLYQILGDIDGQPTDFMPVEAGILVDGVPTAINLVTVKRTYYLYCAVPAPAYSFNPSQR